MTQDLEEAIDEWDDLLDDEAVASEVEPGSELDQAIHRKRIAEGDSGVVPPHGPRAYKRAAGRGSPDEVRDVATEEVLFDDGSDWRAQPTMRIVISDSPPAAPALAPADRPSSRTLLVGVIVAAALLLGAAAFYADGQRREAERLEERIRLQLEASD